MIVYPLQASTAAGKEPEQHSKWCGTVPAALAHSTPILLAPLPPPLPHCTPPAFDTFATCHAAPYCARPSLMACSLLALWVILHLLLLCTPTDSLPSLIDYCSSSLGAAVTAATSRGCMHLANGESHHTAVLSAQLLVSGCGWPVAVLLALLLLCLWLQC